MLAKYEKNRLENVQKHCLRCIFGFEKTYEELLEVSGLSSLEERRKISLKKFAERAVKNDQFKGWFPLNSNRSSQRSGKL